MYTASRSARILQAAADDVASGQLCGIPWTREMERVSARFRDRTRVRRQPAQHLAPGRWARQMHRLTAIPSRSTIAALRAIEGHYHLPTQPWMARTISVVSSVARPRSHGLGA